MRTALRVKFPDQQGKYREICRSWPLIGCMTPRNRSTHRCFFSKFPKIRNRELLSKSREVSPEIRESDYRIRVTPGKSVFGLRIAVPVSALGRFTAQSGA